MYFNFRNKLTGEGIINIRSNPKIKIKKMTAVIDRPELAGRRFNQSEIAHPIPDSFGYFADVQPDETIQELVNGYNDLVQKQGVEALYARLPDVQRAKNGLSFAKFGQPSVALIIMQNSYATDLSPERRFRGQFLRDSLEASGVVGVDGLTPQVLQIASASREADVPLTTSQHLRLASGDVSPIADKISDLVNEETPHSSKVISVGYSLSGFLTPDILLSLNKDKDVVAGLISNPPGVQPESMRQIAKEFAHSGEHMEEHLARSGLKILQQESQRTKVENFKEKAKTLANIAMRATNFSLWRAFSRGQLLQRVQTMRQKIPGAIIDFAFGYEDPLCSPNVLEKFLTNNPDINASVVENGDHAWGSNIVRSLGGLVLPQIKEALSASNNNNSNPSFVA